MRAHRNSMRAAIAKAARLVLGDYAVYRLWVTDRPSKQTTDSSLNVRRVVHADLDATDTDQVLREAAWYFGNECDAFGCFDKNRLVGLACYWHGQRYRSRNSWPIEHRAAKLVHIVTVPSERGKGVATLLIAESTSRMLQKGFCTLYARIWHSNRPSLSAFARAGWRPYGWLLQANPLRRQLPWTFRARVVGVSPRQT
jgi:GNAT superfamily N-acetyltransferase